MAVEKGLETMSQKSVSASLVIQTPGRVLAGARRRRGFTQEKLAGMLGCAPETIRRWERGAYYPTIYYAGKLCEIFRLSPEDLGIMPAHQEEAERVDGDKLPHPENAEITTTILTLRACNVRLENREVLSFMERYRQCDLLW